MKKKNILIGLAILALGIALGWFGNRCYKGVCAYKKISRVENQRKPAKSGEFRISLMGYAELNKDCDPDKPIYPIGFSNSVICIAK